MGQRPATNSYCGRFLNFKICNRTELHAQSTLDGVSHAGQVFVHKVHRSCGNPQCSVCCFSGWAKKEADHIAQRIEVASKRFGQPQHLAISPPESDWGLAEFHNNKFRVKVKKLLSDIGVVGGCLIFHGFSYYNLQESIEKGCLFGWNWHPHIHSIAFIIGGYGKCRSCTKAVRKFRSRSGKLIEEHGNQVVCSGCDGFEGRVRRSYEKNKYIIKCMDERITVFGTAWYQLNHSAIRMVSQ